MGNCHKSSPKQFKGVQNSVQLTREKTEKDKQKLKEYNENLQNELNNKLPTVNIQNSSQEVIPYRSALKDSTFKKTYDPKGPESNFPEFKYHDYDEGRLHKDLIYFNQVNQNFTKLLGKSYFDLIKYFNQEITGTLNQLIMIARGDKIMTVEEFNMNFKKTKTILEKEAEIHPKLNEFGIIELLKKLLEREGITTLLMDQKKEINSATRKKSLNEERDTMHLSFLNLHLTSPNYIDDVLMIEFRESHNIKFNDLTAQTAKLISFTNRIKAIIEDCMDKRNITGEGRNIILSRIIHSEKGDESFVQLNVVFPTIEIQQFSNLIIMLDSIFKQEFDEYSTMRRFNLLKFMQITLDDFDVWGNREFKAVTKLSFKNENMSIVEPTSPYMFTRAGMPYYKPSEGWKRFGFNITKYGISDIWFQNTGSNEEWANCYANISSFLMDRSSGLLTANSKNDFFTNLSQSEDIGDNKKLFQNGTCGRGVIISDRIDNFLYCKDRNEFCTCPVEITTKDNKKTWFLVLLQCRVNPKSIRIPKDFNGRFWIVNDAENVRPHGILVKEIKKNEADVYFGTNIK